jgi:hypothetical protein
VKIHIAPSEESSTVIPVIRRSDVSDAFAGRRIHWMKTASVIARKWHAFRLLSKVSEHDAAVRGLQSFAGRRRFKCVCLGLALEWDAESGSSRNTDVTF